MHSEGLVGDQALQISILDGADHPAVALQVVHDLDDPSLGGIGERLYEVGAAKRVGDAGHAAFIGQDLLGAQRQSGGLLGRQGKRLVPGRSEHRLHPAQHRGHRLVSDADQVVLRLRCIQRRAAAHAAEPEHRRFVRLGAVSLAHQRRPAPSSRTVFGDLLEKVAVGVEEERDLWGELIDGHPTARNDVVAVSDSVGEGECHLLYRGGPGVTKMGSRHRYGVEFRDLGRTELDRVGDQPQRGLRRPDPGPARRVLLEDVVLDRPGELGARNSLSLGGGHVERQQNRRRAIDGETGADLVQWDVLEQDFGVGQGVDRDANAADFLGDVWVVGVESALGGQVERHR